MKRKSGLDTVKGTKVRDVHGSRQEGKMIFFLFLQDPAIHFAVGVWKIPFSPHTRPTFNLTEFLSFTSKKSD